MHKPTPASDNTEFTPVKYSFLEPLQTQVKYPNGETILTGYGIGEQITVMEPRIRLLIWSGEVQGELQLEDGSVITYVPPNIKLNRIY